MDAPTDSQAGPPAGSTPAGQRRVRRSPSVAAAAVGVLVAFGWAGDTGTAAAGIAPAALGGARTTCGGLPFSAAALPGRPVRPGEISGPAEGIGQLLRLSEWSRRSPYDGAHWSVLPAGEAAAVLVATRPGRAAYIPVRRRPDGHWQIDAPCQPRLAR